MLELGQKKALMERDVLAVALLGALYIAARLYLRWSRSLPRLPIGLNSSWRNGHSEFSQSSRPRQPA